MANFNWPSITAASAPVQFEVDGVAVTVSQDTVIPANSTPLPVSPFDSTGAPIDPATEQTLNDIRTEATAQTALQTTIDGNLALLEAKDFATQATLATRASEATLATRASEATLATRASEATLASVDTRVGSVIQSGAGDTFFLVGGRDGGTNFRTIHVDASGNVQTDVLTLPPLPAGTNNIGDVGVLTLPPLPAGTNNIGDVDVVTLPPLPAGTNNIGDVDVLSLPPLPAGTNNIGDVDVLTLPVSYNAGASDAQTLRVIPASNYVPPAPAVPAALTVKQAALTVGTTAVRLTHDAAAPSATRRKLQFIIEPGGAENFFVGSSTVTSAGATRGIRVYPGTLYTYDNDANDWYIISDAAAQTVFLTEVE